MRIPAPTRRSCFALIILALNCSLRAGEPITIDRAPPTARRISFDIVRPPGDMPKLNPGEAALCQYHFDCNVNVSYEVGPAPATAPTSDGAAVTASATIRAVRVRLTLENRIYLPNGANAKIRAHEEGHRIINERVYETADKEARAAAMDVITRPWIGVGATPDAAGKDATDKAVKALCDAYLARTAGVASRVGDIYDELTKHGRHTRLKESDAIEQAFDRWRAEQRQPASAPALSGRADVER